MQFIDFHVDTLCRLYYRGECESGDLYQNNCQVDLSRLIASGYRGQVFACFLDLAKPPRRESPFQDVLGMIDLFEAQTKQYADRVRYAGSWREYEAVVRLPLSGRGRSIRRGAVPAGYPIPKRYPDFEPHLES